MWKLWRYHFWVRSPQTPPLCWSQFKHVSFGMQSPANAETMGSNSSSKKCKTLCGGPTRPKWMPHFWRQKKSWEISFMARVMITHSAKQANQPCQQAQLDSLTDILGEEEVDWPLFGEGSPAQNPCQNEEKENHCYPILKKKRLPQSTECCNDAQTFLPVLQLDKKYHCLTSDDEDGI